MLIRLQSSLRLQIHETITDPIVGEQLNGELNLAEKYTNTGQGVLIKRSVIKEEA